MIPLLPEANAVLIFVAWLTESLSLFWYTGLGATLNVAKPVKGSTVAIFGLGAVGLAVSACNLKSFFSI